MKKECLVCKTEFETTDGRIKLCSDNCRLKYKEYFKKKTSNLLTGIENQDYIVCQWCGMKVKRIYGKHILKFHPEKTSNDYKNDFPAAQLTCLLDKHNTSINSGKHMRLPKYRELASKQISGERNPNHKSKTTELQRKQISPFSKEFYKKRNLKEEDRKRFINKALKDREFSTRLEYWVKKGLSKDEAKEKLKERQTTFSLKKCIEKLGEEKGLERWKQRQEKWKEKVFNENTYIGRGESILSSTIISEIIRNEYSDKFELLYGKNEKFIYDSINERAYKYDLVNNTNKRIIEINGIFWHCKPSLYESNYFHKVKKMTAKEIWEYDKIKTKLAIKKGYKILTIWEDDFYSNPDYVIEKCIKFIYETND